MAEEPVLPDLGLFFPTLIAEGGDEKGADLAPDRSGDGRGGLRWRLETRLSRKTAGPEGDMKDAGAAGDRPPFGEAAPPVCWENSSSECAASPLAGLGVNGSKAPSAAKAGPGAYVRARRGGPEAAAKAGLFWNASVAVLAPSAAF